MLDALYGIEFVSNKLESGYGVVIVEKGRILGGGSSFVYIGSYTESNGVVVAKVHCKNDRRILGSVFGEVYEFNLVLEGVSAPSEFVIQGYMVENPAMRVGVKLSRRAEIP